MCAVFSFIHSFIQKAIEWMFLGIMLRPHVHSVQTIQDQRRLSGVCTVTKQSVMTVYLQTLIWIFAVSYVRSLLFISAAMSAEV